MKFKSSYFCNAPSLFKAVYTALEVNIYTRAANSVDFYMEFKFEFEFNLFYKFEFKSEFNIFIFASSS